ncbi:hypothetical protein RZS08_11530, partial [Arthrospira platensis SPKY1]|nr:hypothetical protein [Arthrospira platensis SPKY1]
SDEACVRGVGVVVVCHAASGPGDSEIVHLPALQPIAHGEELDAQLRVEPVAAHAVILRHVRELVGLGVRVAGASDAGQLEPQHIGFVVDAQGVGCAGLGADVAGSGVGQGAGCLLRAVSVRPFDQPELVGGADRGRHQHALDAQVSRRIGTARASIHRRHIGRRSIDRQQARAGGGEHFDGHRLGGDVFNFIR